MQNTAIVTSSDKKRKKREIITRENENKVRKKSQKKKSITTLPFCWSVELSITHPSCMEERLKIHEFNRYPLITRKVEIVYRSFLTFCSKYPYYTEGSVYLHARTQPHWSNPN